MVRFLSKTLALLIVLRENMAKNKSAAIGSFRTARDDGKFYVATPAPYFTVGPALLAKPNAGNSSQTQRCNTFLSINIISREWDQTEDWSNAAQLQDDMVRCVLPAMGAATPSSAVYLNEANWGQPDCQTALYDFKLRESAENQEEIRSW